VTMTRAAMRGPSRSTASKSMASKSMASKSMASKSMASKSMASKSTVSKSMASKSMASKSTAKRTAKRTANRSSGSRTHTRLAGSERRPAPGTRRAGAVPDDELVEVTVIVRPRAPLPVAEELGRKPLGERQYLSRRAFTAAHGADPQSLVKVAGFASEWGLTVGRSSLARRSIALSGPAGRMGEAFRTRLIRFRSSSGGHRGRTGPVSLPREVAPLVEAVLGLDDRPQAHSKGHAIPPERVSQAFTPKRIAELYDFPRPLDGRGQRIAVIELGGGFRRAELRRYFSSLGLQMPKVTAVSVDGGRNRPGVDSEADHEVVGDIEVIGAAAPGAEILVYFAPLSDRGFIDALTTAIFDPREPSVISISWGDAELNWTEQARLAMDNALRAAATLGITVCAATGDAGWTDGATGRHAHVDYPASSPYVVACGGTRLEVHDTAIAETVWNDHNGDATGGGVSAIYALPSWQRRANVPRSVVRGGRGRGVPDVAANADPQTGYLIGSGEHNFGWGGTSAVAPLWSGLIACLNQGLGTRVGYLNPLLYDLAGPAIFNDVPRGGNGAYRARRDRWDACTGHGTPRGTGLLDALASTLTGGARCPPSPAASRSTGPSAG
jgi:kumamolisin